MREPPQALPVRRTELARRGPTRGSTALQRWADSWGATPRKMVGVGLSLAALGLGGASLNPLGFPLGFLGVLVWSTLMTAGGGLFVLGVDKARRARIAPRGPSTSAREVFEERGRRVRTLMSSSGGDWTFDRLRTRLGWTEQAVVTALLHLRDSGQIIEDLNLETGKWVYRLQDPDLVGPAASGMMSLDDRARRHETTDPGQDPVEP